MSGSEGLSLAELVRELPAAAGATLVAGTSTNTDAVRVRGVHHDSRRVSPGDLFVARRGASSDGVAFVPKARERGAVAIMVEGAALPDDVSGGLPQIVVADVRVALAFAAAAVYGHPAFSLDIVGITGTNGKTTTSHLVRSAIDAAEGRVATGLIGTIGHSYGDYVVAAAHTTPESDEMARVLAEMRSRGATHAVMEVSSIALVLGRVEAVRFRVAAFTNLTQDHLDFHGTMEAYGEAKARLFTALGPGVAVINVDDPFGRALVPRCNAPVVRTSARVGAPAADAEIAPVRASLTRRALEAVFRTPVGEVTVSSRLIGRHNLENLAVALGIAHALELDLVGAAAGLSANTGVPGRLERCDEAADDVTVLVDYAHTPVALARALEASRSGVDEGARLIVVFGCGGDRDPLKRGPMGAAAASGADLVFVTSDNPRTEAPEAIAAPVTDAVRAAGVPEVGANQLGVARRGFAVMLDRAQAIRAAIAAAAPGDLVLIAGKGHEDYQIIGTEKRPFDDRAVSRAALVERRASRS